MEWHFIFRIFHIVIFEHFYVISYLMFVMSLSLAAVGTQYVSDFLHMCFVNVNWRPAVVREKVELSC